MCYRMTFSAASGAPTSIASMMAKWQNVATDYSWSVHQLWLEIRH